MRLISHKHKKYFLLLCFFASNVFCLAQIASPYNFKFINYTTKNGLVHNRATKCLQDSRGFLWIITENGLSRFDGYQFRNFQSEVRQKKSLPNNYLRDIA